MIDLTKYGYEKAGQCNCDGTLQLKFKKGVSVIKYKPGRDTYLFKKSGVSFGGWISEVDALKNLNNVAIQKA